MSTTPSSQEDENLPLRPAEQVMNLRRLGSFHQTRLSFMRILVRKMMAERWTIKASQMELDEHGYGTMVYTIDTPVHRYSYVLFSDYLADEDRNDRVIAEKWDVTMALCMGNIDAQQMDELRLNVPKQEAGRMTSKVMVLSRGNKSSRMFSYVVNMLANGEQPSLLKLAKVGYLYRTTAVYGSGKFGMADWDKVRTQCPEFAAPFAAEMFTCYMLRQFSLEQAEHLAKIKSPELAVVLDDDVKRFFGIGNSTGLGMAPYLVRHPKLISRWVLNREKAISRVVHSGSINQHTLKHFDLLLSKARAHISQTEVPDEFQAEKNSVLLSELSSLQKWMLREGTSRFNWASLTKYSESSYSLETQEMINSLLLELYPNLVLDIQYECVDEDYRIKPEMSVGELKSTIEARYGWALEIDFSKPEHNHYFWYRSEEKMEPRLGERFHEPGAENEMPLTIARLVRQCYDRLVAFIADNSEQKMVAYLLLEEPDLREIVKRIQSMADECYGEIRANLADKELLPMDLLRCKLSFFGVSKFDPKSKLWVRNTMFQGAPVVSDIRNDKMTDFQDDWCFPVAGKY